MNPEHAVTFAAQGRVLAITMPNIKLQLTGMQASNYLESFSGSGYFCHL